MLPCKPNLRSRPCVQFDGEQGFDGKSGWQTGRRRLRWVTAILHWRRHWTLPPSCLCDWLGVLLRALVSLAWQSPFRHAWLDFESSPVAVATQPNLPDAGTCETDPAIWWEQP